MIAPDNAGRAAGSVEFDPLSHVQPSVAPAYESPGPYPGLGQGLGQGVEHTRPVGDDPGEAGRSLGQPAPRGGRWRPGGREESGPKAALRGPSWRPPLSEETPLHTDAEPPAPTTSESVWQAPAWLRPEQSLVASEPSYAEQVQTPAQTQNQASWAPPTREQAQPAAPTWDAFGNHVEPSPASTPASTPRSGPAPSWTPPPAKPIVETPVWDPTARPRGPRIPELSLEPELAGTPPAEFAESAESAESSAWAPPSAPKAADDEYVDGGFADEFDADELDDQFEDEPVIAQPKPESALKSRRKPKPGKPDAAEAPAPNPSADRAPSDDDEFDDDDDDSSTSTGDLGASSTSMTASAQPRKLPWIPIAAVAGALVLLSAVLFSDAFFGAGEQASEADEAAEVAEISPEPEPTPPEPKAETSAEALPKPPPPPAIEPAKLKTMLADATSLVNRQKHDEARVIIDEILGKIPQEPNALALLALVQLEKGEFADALTTANDCVGADAKQADCWITIAIVEQENEQLTRALEGYRKYLEIAPEGRYAKSAKSQAQRLSAKVEG